MLRALDPPCLCVFRAGLSCGSVLGVEDAGEVLLCAAAVVAGGTRGALVAGVPAFAAGPRGLVNVRCEAGRGYAWLRCRGGVEGAVLGWGAGVSFVGEDAADR